jgi:hypothetical protein
LPQAQILIVAAFSGDTILIKRAMKLVEYHLRRNYQAYKSHRKKQLLLLEPDYDFFKEQVAL